MICRKGMDKLIKMVIQLWQMWDIYGKKNIQNVKIFISVLSRNNLWHHTKIIFKEDCSVNLNTINGILIVKAISNKKTIGLDSEK